ncbi:pilus assembly PilX family protein [Thiohalomonas denitrificans]|uniref:pilus assembly PilX family protein n=1 Tax=Thiohalomonas denitrificans TaxID=415747 RepID=UPI0026F2BE33|nr:pilus assembly PilX N-terminal domain-containing protein [Thiohalomonas denitrificans]
MIESTASHNKLRAPADGARPGRQSGAATLLISLILLMAITMVTVFTAKSILLEGRIANNEFRAMEAFEAADAGIDFAFGYLDEGLDPENNGLFVDADGNPIVAVDPDVPTVTLTPMTLASGSAFTLTFEDLGDNRVRITSTGTSADGLASRTSTQESAVVPAVPNVPISPLTTRTLTQISGNITVTNNYGHLTIWSGDYVYVSGDAQTKITTTDGEESVNSTDSGGFGPDVIQDDTNLREVSDSDFFENFFGQSAEEVRADADIDISSSAELTAEQPILSQLIWYEGDLHLQEDLGTQEDPVVLVVNGDLRINSNCTINGIVYVSGDWTQANGGVTINGGVVVEGELIMGNGNLEVNYDPEVLDNTGGIGKDAGLSGSWRDWT